MIDKFMTRLLRAVQFMAGGLFAVVFLTNFVRILLRNLVGITWFWIDGFSRLIFIWTVFLGATALYATDDHLVMNYFVAKIKPKAKRKLDFIINLVFLVLAVVIIFYGLLVFKIRMRIPYTHWNVPTGYAYLAAPVCGLLMLIFCLYKLGQIFRGKESTVSEKTDL